MKECWTLLNAYVLLWWGRVFVLYPTNLVYYINVFGFWFCFCFFAFLR